MSVPQIYGDVADLLPPTCSLCERDASRYAPVGPIRVTVEEPEFADSPIEKVFCCWECVADWFQIQAGRVPPDHGACYRHHGGHG